ncbi:MAG TPA: YhjD/YihY/BrkB family envelope integrity protein [Acidimicrobiia bacterium]|nr:YhjD/YihY/BrkB family envelope integrity protein [Acidimicrobiia bacterium]
MAHSDLPLHKRIFEILKAAGKEFGEDTAGRLAAALSYYTLFSLIPLLFLAVAVVGFVSTDSVLVGANCDVVSAVVIPGDATNPLDRAIEQVSDVAGSQIADQMAQLTCRAADYRSGALIIGIALSAFSASTIFLQMQGVLNQIFDIPEEKTTGLVNTLVQRGIAIGSAVLLAVLVLIPIVAVGAVNFIQDLVDVRWLQNLLAVAVPLTSLLVLVIVTGLTFQLLTRARIPWQAARRGGLFTAMISLLGAFGVGLYLRGPASGGALGALGGVAILLFFFNLMWAIYLFGAEVTKVYADFLEYGDLKQPSEREREREAARWEAATTANTQPESPARTGIVAFVIGLVTGWAASRRD